MATGYEVGMYRDIARIAKALERIADAVEVTVFGVTAGEATEAKRRLREDMKEAGA